MLYTIQNIQTRKIVSVGPKTNKTVFKPFLLTFKNKEHASKVRERLQEHKHVIETNCNNLVMMSATDQAAPCTYNVETPGYDVRQMCQGSMTLGRDLFIVYDVQESQQMMLHGTLVEMHDSEFDS